MTDQSALASGASDVYDVERYRRDFPILSKPMNGQPLVFLDSAASAQKPRHVIDAVRNVYENEYANVHRGAYALSADTTASYEGARSKVRAFVNAAHDREIIFTKNATESINLVAHTYGREFLKAGDEIIISTMEHHSNIVPWQMLRDQLGLVLKAVPISDDGELMMAEYQKMLSPKTKLVAITHTSNALGTVTPAAEIVKMAHSVGAKVLLDGSQAVVHMPVDVQALDADFYVFTGHKLYGPSGVGVLYGKEELLNAMPPFMGGGDMIEQVTLEKSTWAALPNKFEAGTPMIAQVIGLGAAVDYVTEIGMERIRAHEQDLLTYATQRLSAVEGLNILGTAPVKAAVISFTLGDIHPHDISSIIDRAGVACRAGHHCAQMVMDRFDVAGTTRASFGLYNTRAEADALAEALETAREFFG
ncbi:MAG: cysteine desulfurase/selenocysteine lyase [Alphaproteobacteria bacterium]|jgi:cysteine desulfurase/selenocysteine lyase